MEKKKYDLAGSADRYEEVKIDGDNDTQITVRTHIPYEDKDNMAREIAERVIMIHDDSCVYRSSDFGKVKKYYVAKYYTDIDTEDATENEVADFLINNHLWRGVGNVCGYDFDIVFMMVGDIYDAVKTTYEDDKSLTKAMRTSFGFLFNGEDITESLAKAEAMKDMVYEAVGAWRQVEKEKGEKIDNGTLKIGGNIINFAKKKKE